MLLWKNTAIQNKMAAYNSYYNGFGAIGLMGS